jgi:site-specific DNA-adenine methylase
LHSEVVLSAQAGFGGYMVKSIGYGTTDGSRLNLLGLEETILADVTIENLSYENVIDHYRPHTFSYLDPPVTGATKSTR